MYHQELFIRDKVKGTVILLIDVYRRGVLLDGYSPWQLRYRIAVNNIGECWSWYHNDNDDTWGVDNKQSKDWHLILEDLLASGPDLAKAEVTAYTPK